MFVVILGVVMLGVAMLGGEMLGGEMLGAVTGFGVIGSVPPACRIGEICFTGTSMFGPTFGPTTTGVVNFGRDAFQSTGWPLTERGSILVCGIPPAGTSPGCDGEIFGG